MPKPKVLAVSFVILLLLSSGCRPAADTGDSRDPGESGDLVAIRNNTGFLYLSSAGTSQGYYEYYSWPSEMHESGDRREEAVYANLLYTDYRTESRVFLCGTPGCRHNTDSCTSFVSYSGELGIVTNSAGTKIFLIATGRGDGKTEEKDLATIWSMNADGSDREALFRLQPNEMLWGGQIIADQSSLYLRVKTVDPETYETEDELRRFNTLDLTSQTLLTLESEMWLHSAYGEYIFLSEYQKEFMVFYRYSVSTGSMTKVYTWEIPDPANIPYHIVGEKYLFIAQADATSDTGSLTIVDLMDGSVRAMNDLPAFRGGYPALSDFHGSMAQWRFVDWNTGLDYWYFVDLENRTFWERTLTFHDAYKEMERPVEIVADAGDAFLVLYDIRAVPINLYNLDDVRCRFDEPTLVFALIDKEDFYHNVPDFRLITDYLT